MPFGHHWFRFMRYDLGLEKPWFQKYLDKDLAEDVVAGYRNMDDPKIIADDLRTCVRSGRRGRSRSSTSFRTAKKGDAAQTGAA